MELKRWKRAAGIWCARSSAWRVPSTLAPTRSASAAFKSYKAPRWKKWSMRPDMARCSGADTPSRGSVKSPLTGIRSLPPGPQSRTKRSNLARDPGLTNIQMGSPRLASSTTRCRPMKPVPPVTKYPILKTPIRRGWANTLHRTSRHPYSGTPRGPKAAELSDSNGHDNGREHVGCRPGLAADGAADEPHGRDGAVDPSWAIATCHVASAGERAVQIGRASCGKKEKIGEGT